MLQELNPAYSCKVLREGLAFVFLRSSLFGNDLCQEITWELDKTVHW